MIEAYCPVREKWFTWTHYSKRGKDGLIRLIKFEGLIKIKEINNSDGIERK